MAADSSVLRKKNYCIVIMSYMWHAGSIAHASSGATILLS